MVKERGAPNDLLERLAADPAFAAIVLDATLDPRHFIGRAPEQVDEFLRDVIAPIRAKYPEALALRADVHV